MFRQTLCCAVFAAFLAGCTNDVRFSVQPSVVSYSAAFQRQAANEIRSLANPCEREMVEPQECSAIHRLVIDYLLMRDQVRSVD